MAKKKLKTDYPVRPSGKTKGVDYSMNLTRFKNARPYFRIATAMEAEGAELYRRKNPTKDFPKGALDLFKPTFYTEEGKSGEKFALIREEVLEITGFDASGVSIIINGIPRKLNFAFLEIIPNNRLEDFAKNPNKWKD